MIALLVCPRSLTDRPTRVAATRTAASRDCAYRDGLGAAAAEILKPMKRKGRAKLARSFDDGRMPSVVNASDGGLLDVDAVGRSPEKSPDSFVLPVNSGILN